MLWQGATLLVPFSLGAILTLSTKVSLFENLQPMMRFCLKLKFLIHIFFKRDRARQSIYQLVFNLCFSFDMNLESPHFFQHAGTILKDVFGAFPRLLGWLWYILLSFSALLTFSSHISLNLTRIFLIKEVRGVMSLSS